MLSGQPVVSPALIIVCVIMAITAGLIYWVTALGSPWTSRGRRSRCSATGRRRRCAGRRTDPVVVIDARPSSHVRRGQRDRRSAQPGQPWVCPAEAVTGVLAHEAVRLLAEHGRSAGT